MKILIRVSKEMDKTSKKVPGSLEDRYIRLPMEFREMNGLAVGDFINMRTKSGKIITLKINVAYIEDTKSDPMSACVTSEVFKALSLTNVRKHEQEIDLVEGIKLGCDPEFFLINKVSHQLIHAGQFFQKFGEIGHDGLMMEIRPLPSTDEEVVTNNIGNLIRKTRTIINKVKGAHNVMFFGASHYRGTYAGFHLHFGLPSIILHNPIARTGMLKQVVRALDYYVGIPSILAEGEEDYVRRTAPTDYGKPGVHRIDHITLEYRVPSGSMLRHPILTRGLMGLGATVTEDIISRMNACTRKFFDVGKVSTYENLHDIYPKVPNANELFRVICSKNLNQAEKHFVTIRQGIEQMLGFEKRKQSIDAYFDYITSGNKFSYDIEENWGSHYEKQ